MLPDLFRRLKPILGDQVDKAWIAYNLGSPEDKRDIETALTIIALRKQGLAIGNDRIVLEPPSLAISATGSIALGYAEYPGLVPFPVRLSQAELLRHIFLLGPSGTGKSTFIISLLRQFLAQRMTFWCIDFKRNYRCLTIDQYGKNVLVLSVGRNLAPLRINMLTPPPHVERNEWIEALSDIISTAYLLMHGARNVLKNALLGAIVSPRPTLRTARDLLAGELARLRGGSRRYGWLESAHRAMDELSKGHLGEACCAESPTRVETLLLLPTVFELQGLGDDQKRYICLFFLQWILLFRKHQTEQREILHHLLIFDEAHNLFPKEKWGELSLPSRLAREVREFGEAIISATQQADVADSLIANSGTKIILRADHPKDVDFASKLLQVDARWITKIPTGHAIIRLPTRYYQAFLIAFPEQPLKNMLVTDDAVRKRYTQWQEARSLADELQAAINNSARPSPTTEQSAQEPLTPRMRALLQDIQAHPISTTSERYERLTWNPKTGTIVKNALLDQHLIQFEPVNTLKAQIKILTLTKTGADLIGATINRRQGGAAHSYWKEQCTRWLKKHQYTIHQEHPIGNGRTVDLFATNGKDTITIEIETGKADPANTITKIASLPGKRILFLLTEDLRTSYQAIAATTDITLWTPRDLNQHHTAE